MPIASCHCSSKICFTIPYLFPMQLYSFSTMFMQKIRMVKMVQTVQVYSYMYRIHSVHIFFFSIKTIILSHTRDSVTIMQNCANLLLLLACANFGYETHLRHYKGYSAPIGKTPSLFLLFAPIFKRNCYCAHDT
jgi:hypothetical protein